MGEPLDEGGPIPQRDQPRLVRHLGAVAMSRGRALAEAGAVTDRRWSPDRRRVSGTVGGGAPGGCQVTVTVRRAPNGSLAAVSGGCTCPTGYNCEHVAALLLAPALAPSSRNPGEPAAVPAGPGWGPALDALVAPPAATGGHGAVFGGGAQPLGLQFEAVESRPSPGRKPASRPGSRPAGAPGLRIRPVTRSSSGNWVRTDVTWSRLDYFTGWRSTGRVDEQVALLLELRALARLSDPRRWATSSDEAVWLESIASRRVWDLLRQARQAGVVLVAAGRDGPEVVVEDRPADAVLDAVAAGADLELRARLAVSGRDIPASTLLAIGSPVHGVAWWEPAGPGGRPVLHLAPIAAGTHPALVSILAEPVPITIPADRRARFETEIYPALRRRVALCSSDGSVDLPPAEADTVVCVLSHRPGSLLDVSWWLRAGAGPLRAVTDDPDADAGKALMAAAEILAGPAGVVPTRPGGLAPTAVHLEGVAAARFVAEIVPALADLDGVEVVHGGAVPDYREVTDSPAVSVGDASEDRDWLDLHVSVSVGGEEVEFAELFVALAEGRSHLLLPSGAYFSLAHEQLRRLADLIAEARSLHDAPPGRIRLSRFSVSLFDELSDLASVDEGTGACLESLRALAADPAPARPVPAGLMAELRPYQLEGFGWLAARFEAGLGAVLADDMGLGKTLQALAVMCHAREQGLTSDPFLVVAPTSVVGNWAAEAARFAPGLAVATVTETSARRGAGVADTAAGADLVITSYALFRLDHAEYQAHPWAGLFLDEAQFVKNPTAITHIRARRLPVAFKLAMTGTPLENSLTELWALLSITSPGLLGRPDRFNDAYRLPIERHSDQDRLDQLRRRIRPVMLRRTKADVVADLPDKQEQVLQVELAPRHRKLYHTYLQRERQKILGLIGDMAANRFEILRSLTLLRQAALDISLVDPDHPPVPSAKLELLVSMLEEAVADGHRVLVFSQFTRFLAEARRRVEASGIACSYLDGRTRRRQQVIDEFRSGETPVFMISLKAGGFGLNLTEADHCVLLDPWWNPATEAQAVDRAHRIGQARKVMVHRLVSVDTIEEKVMALKDRKSALFSSVVDEGSFSSASLSATDIADLLG